jgi:hypothetical protein
MAKDDWDRRFIELLQELRVMQTGIQILFAYLLTLPFTQRFGELTGEQRVIYVLTLCAAASATAFLIAPVSYHRLAKPAVNKRRVVKVAGVMVQAGLLTLLLAVGGAVFLVMDVVINNGWAAGISSALAILYIGLWYALPLFARATDTEPDDPGQHA